MRITDFFLVIPTFVLAIILTSLIRDLIGSATTEIFGIRMTLIVIVIVIGITSWASTARIIRSQTLSLKERAFVDRARVIGAGGGHIMSRHILPNVVNLIVANAVLVFAGAVLTETTLSFIGLGDPLQPSWGQILESSREIGAPSLGAWWYFVPPGPASCSSSSRSRCSARRSTRCSTRDGGHANDGRRWIPRRGGGGRPRPEAAAAARTTARERRNRPCRSSPTLPRRCSSSRT